MWHAGRDLLILLLSKAWTPQFPLSRPGLTTVPAPSQVPTDTLSPDLSDSIDREGVTDAAAFQLYSLTRRANMDEILETSTSLCYRFPCSSREFWDLNDRKVRKFYSINF